MIDSISFERTIQKRVEKYYSKYPHYAFHNIAHTRNVVSCAQRLGSAYSLDRKSIFNLTMASWFHDVGISQDYANHEIKSIKVKNDLISNLELPKDYDGQLIDRLIIVTKMPQKPAGLLEKIICDADLSHLGRTDYLLWLNKLRIEWSRILGKTWSDQDWCDFNHDFLSAHRFHCQQSRMNYDMIKEYNLRRVRALANAYL